MVEGGLQVRLHEDDSNRDAIGAWIEVDLGGRIIRRENTIGGGHASGHLGWLHFGLGAAPEVKVRVLWPNSDGQWSPWETVQANNFYMLDKRSGAARWTLPAAAQSAPAASESAASAAPRANPASSGTAPN